MGVKVGDVVAWADVPSGALVRWRWAGHGNEFYWKRHNFVASLVGTYNGKWRRPGGDDGSFDPDEPVTIIALDVPADATADDLRTLAEAFEVREAVSSLISADGPWLLDDAPPAIVLYLSRGQQLTVVELDAEGATTFHALDAAAKKLHRAGWRPGMTAEDAARLLAEVRDGEV